MDDFFCFASKIKKQKEDAMEDNGTFIRKDFYIEPPKKDAPVEEWNNWLEADKRKAAAAKAQHTKSLEQAEIPTWMGNSEVWQSGGATDRVVNGVHTQGDMVGFTGDPEEGTCQTERVCPMPSPEALIDIKAALTDIAAKTNKRGGKRAGKSARRRKNKKKGKR
jgi:hypothetical protein